MAELPGSAMLVMDILKKHAGRLVQPILVRVIMVNLSRT